MKQCLSLRYCFCHVLNKQSPNKKVLVSPIEWHLSNISKSYAFATESSFDRTTLHRGVTEEKIMTPSALKQKFQTTLSHYTYTHSTFVDH